jgi:hypothetical protein
MASTTSTSPPIPGFYRVFFTSIDPLIALSGVYMNLYKPEMVLGAVVPATVATWNPAYYPIMQQLTGWHLGTIFLQTTLLRYTGDLGVWRIFQASVLVIDAALGWSIWSALGAQGRRSLAGMRGEDWGTVGITAGVAIIRTAFLLGAGFGQQSGAGAKGKKRA